SSFPPEPAALMHDHQPTDDRISTRLFSNLSFDCLCQLRNNLKSVAYDTVISHIEDRSVRIFVDGDDDIGLFHTGYVLDRSGDTDCEVYLRTNSFTCLTNLQILRLPAVIYNRTGAGNGSADCLCQIVKQCKVLR